MNNKNVTRPTDEELFARACEGNPNTGIPPAIYKQTMAVLKNNIYPNYKNGSVKQADDQHFVIDRSGINYAELIIWSACLLFFLYFLIKGWNNGYPITNYATSLVTLLFLYLLLGSFRHLRHRFVFNRITGEVSYPGTIWFTLKKTRFDDLTFIRSKEGPWSAIPMGLAIKRGKISRAFISYGYPYTMLSFLSWYMDRNRPLPPGSAFDDFRQKDYLRRKNEGFPMPLYLSAIETPEWDGADDPDARNRGFLNYDAALGEIVEHLDEAIPCNFGRW